MVSDSGNILNFARFRKISREDRKSADRKQKEAQAAANRVRFGRTGAEKKAARLNSQKEDRKHEGLRREKEPTPLEDKPDDVSK